MQKALVGVGLGLVVLMPFVVSAEGLTATITSGISSPTNIDTFPITVTFSSPVISFASTSIAVENGTVDPNSFSGDGTTYSFNILATDDGEVNVTLPQGIAQDEAGILSDAASLSLFYDTRTPRPNLAGTPAVPPIVEGPFRVRAFFDIGVVDFSLDKISVIGATLSDLVTNSNANYFFMVNPLGGPVKLFIDEGIMHSAAGNANIASPIIQTRMGPVAVAGTLWQDNNGNGAQDSGEGGLEGREIVATPVQGDGSPDGTRSSITATTDADGRYVLTFEESQYGSWSIAPTLTSGWLLVSGTTTTVFADAEADLSTPVNFGLAAYVSAGGSNFIPINGDEEADGFITLEGADTVIGEVAGASTVRIPPSTTIQKADGSRFNISDLVLATVVESDDGNQVLPGSVRWGLPDPGLSYSNPVTYSLFVGSTYESQELFVQRKDGPLSPWNQSGINDPGVCMVTNGMCTFHATKSPLNPLSPIGGTAPAPNTPPPPSVTAASIKSSYVPEPTLVGLNRAAVLTFSASEAVQTPVVTIGGQPATVSTTSAATNSFRALRTFTAADTEGPIPFTISLTNTSGTSMAEPITSTTDGTFVIYDKTPPVVTSITPAYDSAVVGDPTITFAFNEEVSSVQCRIYIAPFTTPTPFEDCISSSWSPQNIPDGRHRFDIHSADKAGNLGFVAHFLTVSRSAPTITQSTTYSNNGAPQYARTGYAVYVVFTADRLVQTPVVTIAGKPALVATSSSNTTFRATYRMTAEDQEGPVPFSIELTDRAGQAAAPVVATTDGTTVIFDKTAPIVTVSAPENYALVDEIPSFTFSANEDATYWCRVNAEPFVACTSPWAPTSSLPDGAHTFTVRGQDTAGNLGGNVVRHFTLSRSAPALSEVSMYTNNPDKSLARPGNMIYVSFFADRSVRTPVVTIGGKPATVATTSPSRNGFRAYRQLLADDNEGAVPFTIDVTSSLGLATPTVSTPSNGSSVTLDTTAPLFTIDESEEEFAAAALFASQTSKTFIFSTKQPDIRTYHCSYNGGLYQPCTSPHTIENIPAGRNVLFVRAADNAGNITVERFYFTT